MTKKSFKPFFKPLNNQRGAMLIFALVAVVIMGLAAGMAGSSWKTIMQRVREEQLLWVGQQYMQAIESYYNTDSRRNPRQSVARSGEDQEKSRGTGTLPNSLEDLVRDPRFPGVVRHLREIYQDPMAREDFVLLKDQGGRIRGVRSSSRQKPFKTDDFPEGLEDFAGAESYADWEFVFETPRGAPQPGGVNFSPDNSRDTQSPSDAAADRTPTRSQPCLEPKPCPPAAAGQCYFDPEQCAFVPIEATSD